MRTFASAAKTADYYSAHRSASACRGPGSSADEYAYSIAVPHLYRKGSCACGGACPECQAKAKGLKISQPNDAAEIEADEIAERVMRMPKNETSDHEMPGKTGEAVPKIHRKCTACEDEGTIIRRNPLPLGDRPAEIKSQFSHAPYSSGQPLDEQTRSFFEPKLGYDLSSVRIHTNSTAGASARALDARAYTLGSDIVFGSGEYQPHTQSGKRLIAHELAHVAQTSNSTIKKQTIFRQPAGGANGDLAAVEYEIKMLSEIPALGPEAAPIMMRLAQLEQRRIQLLAGGAGNAPPPPPPPKPALDLPFAGRFAQAWQKAKETALQKVRNDDKAYRDFSISRGLIDVKDLVPSAREVWKAGIYGGLFKNDEKELVDASSAELVTQSFEKRYKASKYGHVYGDERYYESSGRRRDDDTEIWTRGRSYGLFFPDEKAAVLRISQVDIGMATTLNAQARVVDPKTLEAGKLMDAVHKFTDNPGVVLLGPEMERLFGPFGYTYREVEDRWTAATEINKAYDKSLQSGQILKDPNASVEERWDECMRRRSLGKNDLEAAAFDSRCFQSKSEFDKEYYRRAAEHDKQFEACGHSGPKDYECRDRIDAVYYPRRAAREDIQLRQAYQQYQQNVDNVVNSGGFATGGRLVGYVAAKLSGRDEAEALRWSEGGAIIGGIGDIYYSIKAGVQARAASQNYNEGGGHVVRQDAAITQTIAPDPWAPTPASQTPRRAYIDGQFHDLTDQPKVEARRGGIPLNANEPSKPTPARDTTQRDDQRRREVAEEFEQSQKGASREPGLRRDDPRWSEAAARVEENAVYGRMNEAYLRGALNTKLSNDYDKVGEQVRIRPNLANGKPADFYFIADYLARTRQTGRFVNIDAKLTPSATLSPNQTSGYPLLSKYGGKVESRNSVNYPYGTVLPPTPAFRAEPTVNLKNTVRPKGTDIDFKITAIP